MKTIIIYILLTITLNAQYFNTQKISQIAFSGLAGYSAGQADYCSGLGGVANDREFHKWQGVERISFAVVGVSIGLQEKPSPIRIMADLVLSGGIFMTVHTMALNNARGKP